MTKKHYNVVNKAFSSFVWLHLKTEQEEFCKTWSFPASQNNVNKSKKLKTLVEFHLSV